MTFQFFSIFFPRLEPSALNPILVSWLRPSTGWYWECIPSFPTPPDSTNWTQVWTLCFIHLLLLPRGRRTGGTKKGLGPPIFGTTKTSGFSTKVCVSCSCRCAVAACLALHAWWCPWFSVVPEAMHNSRGPLKSAVPAQKARQGSEMETRELLGGTEENSVSPTRGYFFAIQKIQKNPWIFLLLCPQ